MNRRTHERIHEYTDKAPSPAPPPSTPPAPSTRNDTYPVLQQSRVTVVTAVSGIGAAAAPYSCIPQRAFARLGMKIALVSLPPSLPALTTLAAEHAQISKHAGFDGAESDVLVVPTDVTVLADVEKLRETV